MKRPKRQILAIAAVMVAPALLAFFLTRQDASEPPTPEVTRLLEALSDEPSPGTEGPAPESDSPAAGAQQGGESIAIDFKRGSRVALGEMDIPAIDVHTKFFEGVVDEAVKRGPGHWPGTPWPGERGNSVFAGHRTTFTHPFADLDLLKPGDRIRTRPRNGRSTMYRVFKTSVVPEAEYAEFVLTQPRNNNVRMITLFACTPKGFRTHRIIVQAKASPDRGGQAQRGEGVTR